MLYQKQAKQLVTIHTVTRAVAEIKGKYLSVNKICPIIFFNCENNQIEKKNISTNTDTTDKTGHILFIRPEGHHEPHKAPWLHPYLAERIVLWHKRSLSYLINVSVRLI